MKYISATELRTKSKDLLRQLRDGGSVYLISKSKVVGEIIPSKKSTVVASGVDFSEHVRKNSKALKLRPQDIKKEFRGMLIKKYEQEYPEKNISGC